LFDDFKEENKEEQGFHFSVLSSLCSEVKGQILNSWEGFFQMDTLAA